MQKLAEIAMIVGFGLVVAIGATNFVKATWAHDTDRINAALAR